MENENSLISAETKTSKKAPKIFFGLILFFSLATLFIWLFFRGTESTEDAKIVGHIASVAPRINGQVVKIFVDNNSLVKEGDALVLLDDSLERANVDLAQADFDAAVANFKQATVDVKQARAAFLAAKSSRDLEYKNLNRVLNLSKQKAITQEAVDQQQNRYGQAQANLESAQAVLYMSENVSKMFGDNIVSKDKDKFLLESSKMKGFNPTIDAALAKLKRAKASLNLATLNLTYTTVRAPFAGVITNRNVEVGENVGANVPVFSLVSSADNWVIANFKETQLKHIHGNELATIRVDAYGGKQFEGVVESLSPASGDSFALLPPDNASGNFVKVTQRFPVKINFKPYPSITMRPGMSVSVQVKVTP